MDNDEVARLLRAVVDGLPAIIWLKDLAGTYLYVNDHAAAVLGRAVEEIRGRRDSELFPAEVVATWRTREAQVARTGAALHAGEETFTVAGERRTYVATLIPLRDEAGEITATAWIASNVTQLQRAEAERARLQEDLIRAQQQALQELSLPVIPVSDQVVVMPLIGPIDSRRAEQIMDALLEKVAERQAKVAIVDLTGVRVVDSAVASSLLRTTEAVRLLGARVVITGIGPEVAETIVRLGLNTERFAIRSTLMDGIRYAMERKIV